MTFRAIRIFFFLFIFSLPAFSFCFAASDYSPYVGVVHVHSGKVPGRRTAALERLLNQARDGEVRIVLFTDTFLRRVEYRLPRGPLAFFRITLEGDSAVKYGIGKALEDLQKIKNEFPDMIILPGFEVAPLYRWTGSLFKKDLSLNGLNKHLLVIGLKTPGDYRHLPVISNRYFLPKVKDLPFLLLCALLAVSGALILRKNKKWKIPALTMIAAGVIFFLNLFPFSVSPPGPDRDGADDLAYQGLIDYVNRKGGLVFWAHPEITKSLFMPGLAGIQVYTPSYPEALIRTCGYAGFGVSLLPGANHNIVLAGGEWDGALLSYCQGKKSRPPWVMGEADYSGAGKIGAVQNIFLLAAFREDSVYDALNNGRLYARYYSKGSTIISLDEFHIQDALGRNKPALMGDELESKGNLNLAIRGSYRIEPLQDLRIELIRDGEIERTFTFGREGRFDLELQEDLSGAGDKKSYYRLNVFADMNLVLVTNPIFVKVNK